MYAWNLTAKTIMSVEEWKLFFKENNYTEIFLVYSVDKKKSLSLYKKMQFFRIAEKLLL